MFSIHHEFLGAIDYCLLDENANLLMLPSSFISFAIFEKRVFIFFYLFKIQYKYVVLLHMQGTMFFWPYTLCFSALTLFHALTFPFDQITNYT